MLKDINRRVNFIDTQARREKLTSPEWIQRQKAVRYPTATGEAKQYAEIVQSLSRGNVLSNPPVSASNKYYIKLTDDEEIDVWSSPPPAVNYVVDDLVDYTYTGGDGEAIEGRFKCIKDHESHESRPPTNATFWENVSNLEAGVLHYDGDLLQTAPWFQVGDIVEVVYYEEEWKILATVIRTETITDEGTADEARRYSTVWEDGRLKAVYA